MKVPRTRLSVKEFELVRVGQTKNPYFVEGDDGQCDLAISASRARPGHG
jgi:hypothetical protein